ncbi:unnamed protein product [Penicillium salamii]|uniref:Serine hydrolase domain-containing protein n=1 Tax=Penicillium salamii TaxID=1612424 RepID=A0A9W4IK83_9EURO|nr:unnamed protein product [Penicillium salamii]CAG8241930.1 unnamed protein product [Penicillium salamii]CAG8258951.1 unnamed protein product [Penicillium salamii]CAG8284217.1 unnamed protein product [Penicillium salamii]CAG8291096.1 unnamed protein product [Penicillium salamii]
MRVLCLHGHGTSSDIFETQLSAIRNLLDESVEYVYIDGPVESDRVRGKLAHILYKNFLLTMVRAGMSEMVPGPFFGWFSGFSPAQIKETHTLVAEALEEDGPFDAIFGFSQGATLALCYLLEHQIRHPDQPPPVHFAVLFSCAGPAFSSDTNLARDIIHSLAPEDFERLRVAEVESHTEAKDAFLATMRTALQLGGDNGFVVPADEIDQWERVSTSTREQLMTRVFHPSLTATRVKIPTIHVLGDSDTADVLEQAELCRGLCDPRSVERVAHSAAHDVPRKPDEARQVAEAIRAAEAEACLMIY